MDVEWLGFDSEPVAIVFWIKDNEPRFKTVCFDENDVLRAMERSRTKDDFYYGMQYTVAMNESNRQKTA